MRITRKDLAEFAANAFHYGLTTVNHIRLWADHLIENSDDPPHWMIDLAFAKRADVCFYLDAVPGSISPNTPQRLVCMLLAQRWKCKQIDLSTIHSIGRQLAYKVDIDRELEWGLALDAWMEEFNQGWRSAKDIHSYVEESLQPFSKTDDELPVDFLILSGYTPKRRGR